MKPILCFASCNCIEDKGLSIQALFQKTFDGEFIYFELRCLYCDAVNNIKESIDECELLTELEGGVMDFLSKDESGNLLKLAMEGRTYSNPKKYNQKSLQRRLS